MFSRTGACFLVLLLLRAPSIAAQSPNPVLAKEAILAAFDHYPLVAIGEMHRNVEEHAFLRQLISDRRFSEKATNIVVEFGNARYQPLVDRYLAGEQVPPNELERIWRYTTQFMVWDAPIYAEFFATVRQLNARRPKSHQLRVLLSDPPIDWSKVKTKADYEPFAARDPDAADVITREVLAKGQRALIIFGANHLQHSDPLESARGKPGLPGLTQILDQHNPGKTFVVWPVSGPRAASGIAKDWPADTLVNVHNSPLQDVSFAQLTSGSLTIFKRMDGKTVPYEVKPGDYGKIGDVVDAILYLGPVSTESEPPANTYRDQQYVTDLRHRAAIMKEVFGMDFSADLDEALEKLHQGKN